MTASGSHDLCGLGLVHGVTPASRPGFGHAEVAELAFLNWQKAGCPAGRDLQNWLDAEAQLKVTWHLLTAACDAAVAAEVLAEVRLTDLAFAFGEGKFLKEA